MDTSSIQQLQTSAFFKDLPQDIIQSLLNLGRLCKYSKREIIFHAGIYEEQVYLLLEGEVMVYNLTKHGNKKILFILGKGHLLNHNIVSQRPVSVFCEAVQSAQILEIPLRNFLELMACHPCLTQSVMERIWKIFFHIRRDTADSSQHCCSLSVARQMSAHASTAAACRAYRAEYERYIWRLSHQLKNTSGSLLLERKIAAKLWKLGRDFGIPQKDGVHIRIKMTMTLLADFVGAPRENVSRACKSLSQKGLLYYQNQQFILPDMDELSDFYKQN